MEVPTNIGASGIQLTGINPNEHEQFLSVVQKLENYSQNLVKAFDETTLKIHQKLENNGDVALLALKKLGENLESLNTASNTSQEEMDSIISEVEAILSEFSGLDALQSEILLLSDLLTAVEEAVKNQQT